MKDDKFIINTPQTFRDKAYLQSLWERKRDGFPFLYPQKSRGESEENVVPSIQQKACWWKNSG